MPYIQALDGLRGIAVLAVIAFHLARHGEPQDGLSEMIISITRFGWVGVDLFFVLSGFLITGILFDNQGGRTWIRAFYGRRLLRIIPVYFLLLALYAVVASMLARPGDAQALYSSLPWHATFLTNIRVTLEASWTAAPLNTGHFWSLAVEEQYYLLWPGAVALAARWSSSPRLLLMRLSGGLVLCALVFRLALLPESAYGAYTLLPARMDSLAVGAFIALWARGPGGVRRVVTVAKPLLVVCCVALLVIALATAGMYSYLQPLQQSIGYTLWAVAFGGLVIHAASATTGGLNRCLTVSPLILVGRISYGLYLFHFPVIWILSELGWKALGFVFFSFAVLAISIGLAWISWIFIESPILALKRHLPYHASRFPRTSRVYKFADR